MGQRVLITGISGYLAGLLAKKLEADPGVETVVGIGLRPPSIDLGRTEFIRADIRSPLVVEILQTTGVDTVVHLGVLSTPAGAGGRTNMKETNVIGSMQLMAACQRSKALRRVILKSTTGVYGADARNPASFTEGMTARDAPRGGYSKDASEIEGYARTLARRRPDLRLTILRFANLIGPRIVSAMTRYFSLPVVPVPLGYDARLELLHEDDALEVLYRTTREEHPGLFNLSPDGIVYLSQALRLLSRPSMPVAPPFVRPLAGFLRRLRLVDFAGDQLAVLVHGRITDNDRLKRELTWAPAYTSREALTEFAGAGGRDPLVTPERLAAWERDIRERGGRMLEGIISGVGRG